MMKDTEVNVEGVVTGPGLGRTVVTIYLEGRLVERFRTSLKGFRRDDEGRILGLRSRTKSSGVRWTRDKDKGSRQER